MANASIAQSVNRQTVAAALQAARTEAAEHRAWINAINRAALNLEACPWAFDGEVLRIASASSTARYTVGVDGWNTVHRITWMVLPVPAQRTHVHGDTGRNTNGIGNRLR